MARHPVVSLLAALAMALAVLPQATAAIREEPPCTDTTCETGTYCNATVVIDISWNSVAGNITIMLYEEGAPVTTANFLMLTDQKFFDGCKFHRCIDGFVAQTGDPNSKNNNPYDDGYGGSSQTIPLEINDTLTHIDGAVGMARSTDPNSASSQFYICDGPQHGLDGNYSVFGVVVDGMDLAKQIAAAPTYGQKRPLLKDHPVDDIVMTSVVSNPGHWVNATNGTSAVSAPSSFLSGGAATGMGIGVLVAAAGATVYLVWRRRRKETPVDLLPDARQ
jgi:peptidyl-prolyl cis-trans isomerase B (cyclophilin B)